MTESNERITCQELTELVNDYIEGALSSHETALFEQHLNFCDGCDWYVDQMRAIAALPAAQQSVIRMRDVEGYSSDEVCAALDVSEGNQRVLLHRARSRVRAALEEHLDG